MIDIEQSSSPPGSPGASPLQVMSPDRVNQQREAAAFSIRPDQNRDSDVHDKIRQFNNLAHHGPAAAASMSRQLERKTADAALKRAMLGREEAEAEMRRYRDEARVLRRQIEESRGRERKISERLEDVMEKYGQAKETLQHSKAIWEKEVRQARKELFKSQSSTVKLQEELKAVRSACKSTEESLAREKDLSKAREQEAFTARYQLVELQEQLEKALERVTFAEQERDAYRAAAKSEEIARIAAEGHLPLPPEEPDSEFASPKKSRVSLSTVDILSSAASEAEIEELTRLWQWEKQRADRAQDHLEFVQAECELRTCACAKTRPRRSIAMASARQERPGPMAIVDPADLLILGKAPEVPEPSISPEQAMPTEPTPAEAEHQPQQPEVVETPLEDAAETTEQAKEARVSKVHKEPRRSTIFVPSEGIFRTVSQLDMEAMEKSEDSASEPPTPVDPQPEPPYYARTPSVDPPTFALMAQERVSLLSLLNAPHEGESQCMVKDVPTMAPETPAGRALNPEQQDEEDAAHPKAEAEAKAETETETARGDSRPHTSAAFYTMTTTTTVPIRDNHENRTPSFDINNPALTPTMTREQALAQIKERRGRARSAAQGMATPRRQMVSGTGSRRDASAPAARAAKGRSA
ncbi:hypothetical protein Hte_011647 [Hypoxylon texense]